MAMAFGILKPKILLGSVIAKRIKIKEKEKLRSIYLQFFVSRNDKSIVPYQQIRFLQEITIKGFSERYLKREIECSHEKFKIEDTLMDEKINTNS